MWQFTIWWRWSAMLASNCNNMILTNKKGCSLQCFLLRKSLHLYGHVRRCQENAWKGKQLDNKTARLRQLCCWVAILSAAAEIKRLFSYQIIAMVSSDLMQVNSSGSGSGCSPENIHFSGILGSLLELRTPAKQMYSRCPAVYMAYCTCLGNRPCTAIAWIRLWFSGI